MNQCNWHVLNLRKQIVEDTTVKAYLMMRKQIAVFGCTVISNFLPMLSEVLTWFIHILLCHCRYLR